MRFRCLCQASLLVLLVAGIFSAALALPNNNFFPKSVAYVKEETAGKEKRHSFKSGGLASDNIASYYIRGIKRASKGDFEEARVLFGAVLTIDKSDFNAKRSLRILSDADRGRISKKCAVFLFKSLVNLNNGLFGFAVDNLKKVIKENPDYALAYLKLGSIYYYLGKYEQAFAEWEKVIKVDVDCDICAYAYMCFGMVYQDFRQFEEAKVNLQRAKNLLQLKADEQGVKDVTVLLKLLPQNANYFYYREAVRSASEGRFEEAKERFKNALLFDKLDYESLKSLKNLNDLSEGRISEEYALHLFKGLSHLTDGGHKEAIKEMRKALEINNNYARGVSSLGSVYFLSGQTQQALPYYEKAIEIDPAYALAYYNLGVIYASSGQPEKAITFYQKSIELDPEYAPAYNNLGVVYKSLGQIQKATAYYQKAIEIKPDFYNDPYNNLGNVYSGLDNLQQAVSYYEKALDVEPFDASAYEGIAIAYYNSNQFGKAIPYYEKAIELDRSNIKFYVDLGQAYERLRRFKQAEVCYEKALRINRKSADGYVGLARVKFSLGQTGKMRKSRNKAKEIYQSQGNSQKVKEMEDWIKASP